MTAEYYLNVAYDNPFQNVVYTRDQDLRDAQPNWFFLSEKHNSHRIRLDVEPKTDETYWIVVAEERHTDRGYKPRESLNPLMAFSTEQAAVDLAEDIKRAFVAAKKKINPKSETLETDMGAILLGQWMGYGTYIQALQVIPVKYRELPHRIEVPFWD